MTMKFSLSLIVCVAIEQCALRFERDRWNCSIEDAKEVFGQTLKSANRESAFVQAIVSAGITYSITKACSTGNLANCACDYSQYELFSDVDSSSKEITSSNQRGWHWAGCWDNLAYGIKLSQQFLDTAHTKKRTTSNKKLTLRDWMNLHNNQAGREAIKKLMRLKCRCHGSSGSCQMKTCWKVLPKFEEIGKFLKKQYQQAVQIEGIQTQGAHYQLKRSRRSTMDQSKIKKKRLKASRTLNLHSSGGHKLANQNSHQTNQQLSSQMSNDLRTSEKGNKNQVLSSHFNEAAAMEMISNSYVNKVRSSSSLSSFDDEEIDEDDDYYEEDEEERRSESNSKQISNKISEIFSQQKYQQVDKVDKQAIFDRQTSTNRPNNNAYQQDKPSSVVEDNFVTASRVRSGSEGDKKSSSRKQNSINRLARKEQTTIKSNKEPVVSKHRTNSRSQRNKQQVISEHQRTMLKISNRDNNDLVLPKTPEKLDLVYLMKSPNYCVANDALKTLGTVARSCRRVTNKENKKKFSDSCESLCCGRGYNKHTVLKTESCQCEFDISSTQVKCQTCDLVQETYTCK